jgi:hypothetical protein
VRPPEAGIEGIPADRFSLLDYDWNVDLEAINHLSAITLRPENKLPKDVVLNVNSRS